MCLSITLILFVHLAFSVNQLEVAKDMAKKNGQSPDSKTDMKNKENARLSINKGKTGYIDLWKIRSIGGMKKYILIVKSTFETRCELNKYKDLVSF